MIRPHRGRRQRARAPRLLTEAPRSGRGRTGSPVIAVGAARTEASASRVSRCQATLSCRDARQGAGRLYPKLYPSRRTSMGLGTTNWPPLGLSSSPSLLGGMPQCDSISEHVAATVNRRVAGSSPARGAKPDAIKTGLAPSFSCPRYARAAPSAVSCPWHHGRSQASHDSLRLGRRSYQPGSKRRRLIVLGTSPARGANSFL